MIKEGDINNIVDSLKSECPDISEKDIAFLSLSDVMDKDVALRIIYGNRKRSYPDDRKLKILSHALIPFGIGVISESGISREQNKAELIKLLKRIEDADASGTIDAKDALKMEADIRVKLNDKFDMEEERGSKRIIVVPQKHDIVCPHTNRECTFMPTKSACMKYYGLTDNSGDKK
jgi:hypothetical protein